eukprot:augustus_masked-scaffold_10-processed-gene-7.30-mRNA-1 protein AED:1.00 eAED:1.00 QI:0/-1/0/0/-1/1/1/0/408
MPQATKAPLKLGQFYESKNTREALLAQEPKKNSNVKYLVLGIVFLVAVVGVVFFLFPEEFTGESEVSSQGTDGEDQEEDVPVTPFPTISVTDRPTAFPTLFPTTLSPTVPTIGTPEPTRSPSSAPTNAPLSECQDADAQCGCNQVTSDLLDIVFLVDESGSVTRNNYRTMVRAITNFISNEVSPAYNIVSGTRFAYLEFSDPVNDIISFNDFETATDFIDQFQVVSDGGSIGYDEGGTDHRGAFLRLQELLRSEDGAPREDAQLLILMITDGNPCKNADFGCYNSVTLELESTEQEGCCSNSERTAHGTDVLIELAEEFDFTFFFLPIVGNEGFSTDLFDGAIKENDNDEGLEPEEFVLFEIADFDSLAEFLNGDDFEVPLGPCIDPPTSSGGDRRLEEADFESKSWF